jgi:flagellar motility protein MotE (MotC chaperone)
MNIREKVRLLPILIITAMLAFTVRVGEFVSGLEDMGSAHAQQEVATQPPPMGAATAPNTATTVETITETATPEAEISGRLDLESPKEGIQLKSEFEPEGGAAPANPALATQGERVEWKDSIDTEIDDSAVKDEIYKDLAQRRELLERKEKEIGVREALLSAAERELDQKLRELTNIRTEIEASMKKQSAEEEARIGSLVKIYEGMKPKDAASILNTLDLDVLMVIMTKMSERKSSAILSEMNPERARTVTVMLAEQRQMPSLVPEN